ncbi:MAG: EpsI family protein [Burkholderiales bacterium]|nr:EpsI family protein [Burkholderiales bacterium]
MNAQRRKAVLALLGMGAAAALAKAGVPTKKIADQWETDLEKMFPAQFGDWQVDTSLPVVLPAPDVQAKLDAIYNQVLARTYVNRRTGERVMLSVAYGGDQSDGMSVHLPEVCYPAQGFQVLSRSMGALLLREPGGASLPVVRLSTKLGQRAEPVTYWITVGDLVVPTRTQQKLAQLRYGLRGEVPDGMLIRVSSIDRSAGNAFAIHDSYVRDLRSSVSEMNRTRLFGTAGQQ